MSLTAGSSETPHFLPWVLPWVLCLKWSLRFPHLPKVLCPTSLTLPAASRMWAQVFRRRSEQPRHRAAQSTACLQSVLVLPLTCGFGPDTYCDLSATCRK